MPEWKCQSCGALNTAHACEACGADQPSGTMPATETSPLSATERLMQSPLCPHVTQAGTMCAACQAEVDGYRKQIQARFSNRDPTDAADVADHERKKQRALAQAKALEGPG